MKKTDKTKKICLISSSGGHYEQLKMLMKLKEKYQVYVVTEKTEYDSGADYYLLPPPSKKNKFVGYVRFFLNIFASLFLFIKERPDVVISTGTRVAIPTVCWAKIFGKKVVYIETFARVYDGTKSAKLVYKYKLYDLFIYQWEPLKEIYPDGVYGGGIY